MGDIRNKVAVVTGAGRGIGRGIAIAYGRAGAKVVVSSRTAATVDKVVGEIREEGGAAVGITCDVGDRAGVFDVIDQAAKTFGTVDILVNNAQSSGYSKQAQEGEGRQPLEIYDEGDWEIIYRTGVLSTLWAMKATFPYMRERGGKIINLGSMGGQAGLAGFGAYNAAKEAIRAITRTAAREWGRYKINVNCMNPGARTDALIALEKSHPAFMEQMRAQIPMGRWGEPIEDCGALAIFLGSSDADYITGMTIMLDGGQFMSP